MAIPYPFIWNSLGSGGGGGGGSSDSFTTIQTPSGTSPVADSTTDTLTLSSSGTVSITGDSSTDTVSFDIASGAITNTYINASAGISFSKLESLASGNILVGNGSNVATSVNPSGDIDVDSSGVFSISSGVIVNADVNASAAIAGTKIDPNFGSQNITTTGTSSVASESVTGTGGSGFVQLANQSSAPSTPSSSLRIYASSLNGFCWRGTDGFTHEISHAGTANRTYTLPDATGTFTFIAATQTLTNKTIDADQNTITNIENADIKAAAGIAVSKLAALTASRAVASDASGFLTASSATSTELGYLSGVTGNVQSQLDDRLLLDGSNSPMTGYLTLFGDPVNPLEAATKSYVDSLAAGLKWKSPVRVATTANGTLASDFENGDTIDGVTLATNDRILLKNQSTTKENGIYTVNASGSPTRATDADVSPELDYAAVYVTAGTANAGKAYVQTETVATIGTDTQTWVNLGGTTYTADGQGLELTGTTFALELDGSTLSKSGTGLKVNSITSSLVSDFDEAAQDATGAMISSVDFQYTDATPLLSSKKTIEIKVMDDNTTLTTGDGKYIWVVPSQFNNRVIIGVFATVTTTSSSGTPTVQIHNITDAVDVLSTALTIDANEYSSDTAATAAVINTSNDDLSTGDRIRIDVDVAGTGAKGLSVGIIIGV